MNCSYFLTKPRREPKSGLLPNRPSMNFPRESMAMDPTRLTLAPLGSGHRQTKCNRWTEKEDMELRKMVTRLGERWATIGKMMPNRIGKQCRERWYNHLRPEIKKDIDWTNEEEETIVRFHKKYGNKWSTISRTLQGRTENAVKNHWNATKRKIVNHNMFLESSPLQRYIGLSYGASPWKRDAQASKDQSLESSIDPSSSDNHGSTSGDQPIDEAPKEGVVLIDFFAK